MYSDIRLYIYIYIYAKYYLEAPTNVFDIIVNVLGIVRFFMTKVMFQVT